MLDHIGIGASDFEASRAFYEAALAPLGIALVMEVTPEQSGGYHGLGLGKAGKPFFLAMAVRRALAAISLSPRMRGPRSMPSTPPRWRRAGATMADRGCGLGTTRTIMARSCSIPTGPMSKRSATERSES